MAVTISKAMADAIASNRAASNWSYLGAANAIAFVDGGASDDSITDTGNGLGGAHVGDYITAVTHTGTNDGTYLITSVAAGTIGVPTGSLTAEVAATAARVALFTARGGSLYDLLKYGVIRWYTGTRPASPEAVETGTLVCTFTDASGAFAGGADTNGLLLDPSTIADGIISKLASQTWSGVGAATDTATWGRYYSNAYNTGADAGEAYIRMDFDVGLGADLDMDPSVTATVTKTITDFSLQVPLS